ncbi:MAG: nickel-responsive transcriptional regulator NikR [Fretibacterium sp.]|nr:nickel-responsive transcriptional regulator NikR [Fretibacterium sp.]
MRTGKTKKTSKLARFSITMPEPLLQEFDKRVQSSGRNNRSEAFRKLMRRYIAEEQWRAAADSGREEREVYGTVTLVYDHHLPNLTRRLTGVQHDHGKVILCTTHVHVAHDTCLECIVMRGAPGDVQNFLEALGALRGIKSLEKVIVQGA